jgi:hypothetical protein
MERPLSPEDKLLVETVERDMPKYEVYVVVPVGVDLHLVASGPACSPAVKT